jgi:hypothetical protein
VQLHNSRSKNSPAAFNIQKKIHSTIASEALALLLPIGALDSAIIVI